MELKKLLMKRHLTELIRIARNREVKFDGILTKAEEKAVLSELKHRGEESLLYFYDYAMSGEAMYDDETLQEYADDQKFAEFYALQMRLIEALRKLDAAKEETAERIAEVLLRRKSAEELMNRASEYLFQMLDQLSDTVSDQGAYITNLPLDWNRWADELHLSGYGYAEYTKPLQNADGHRHCTSLMVSEDVLKLFQEICTPEYRLEKQTSAVVSDICYMVEAYYGIAPVEIGMKLYRIIKGETLPELSEEDFIRIGRKERDNFYAYRKIEGKWFIIEDLGYANDTDTLTEEEMDFFGEDIERMKEENYNFYIPDRDEITEFIRYGYWPSRKGYRQLRQFLEEYYLDEQTIDLIGRSFMNAAMGINEETASAYDMDRVEDEVQEAMALITSDLMNGNQPEDIEETQSIIFETINDESKERLRGILQLCHKQTNQRFDMGYAGRIQQ